MPLLDDLKHRTKVACDTMDLEIIRELGLFQDCTSNQAIALKEFQDVKHHPRLQEAGRMAKARTQDHDARSAAPLAVEISMMSLAVDILRLITGRVHIQVNPRQAFDQITIEESVLRLRDHFRRFEPRSNPDEDLSRVCFKIPSTWEGLMACRSLEAQGISTLATTVFSVSQAVLAAEVGCAYVAPYLHALGEDFQNSGQEESGAELCQKIMKLYLEAGYKTQIIPAAFQTIEEVLPLSNMHHMTMSPALLRELAKTENSKASAFGSQSPSSISSKEVEPEYHRSNYINDEAAFRQQLLRNQAVVEAKTNAAIAHFCKMQDKLEELVRPFCED